MNCAGKTIRDIKRLRGARGGVVKRPGEKTPMQWRNSRKKKKQGGGGETHATVNATRGRDDGRKSLLTWAVYLTIGKSERGRGSRAVNGEEDSLNKGTSPRKLWGSITSDKGQDWAERVSPSNFTGKV